jgi:hypothetical protein
MGRTVYNSAVGNTEMNWEENVDIGPGKLLNELGGKCRYWPWETLK